MKHVGFTGTEKGMTFPAQATALYELMLRLNGDVLHHGDCIGADAEAHQLASEFGWAVHVHPPVDSKKRAHCRSVDYLHREKPYLDRNHDIVDASEVLIACPHSDEKPGRAGGGTWATVRYARKRNIPIFIVYPSGMVIEELGR